MAKQDDGLFLLEVLIDKIVFLKSPCFSDKDFRTCVTIECPAVQPLEICDDDPGACVAKSGGPFVKTFNIGKSCLFSLQESDISKAMSSFPVKVSIYKSLPCGCLPTKIVMGEATIDMTKEFVQSRKKYLEDPTNINYQALKDSFRVIGPDGTETGEIIMFLRISCFGKLIITRFQGGSGPPNLGAGQGSSIVDRSCNPRREFQTSQDPCVCGAAQAAAGSKPPEAAPCTAPCKTAGGGGSGYGVCPTAPDPYNSMPCEDPDDPCFCSGPKAPPKQQMICRNTDPYCLHIPKGAQLSLPIYQDLTEDQIMEIKTTSKELKLLHLEDNFINLLNTGSSLPCSDTGTTFTIDEYLQSFPEKIDFSTDSIEEIEHLGTSLCAIKSKRRSVSFSDEVDYVSKSYIHFSNYRKKSYSDMPKSIFGKKETAVYMTLFDDFCCRRTSGTQATASINKCLQASHSKDVNKYYVRNTSDSNNCSTCNTSTLNSRRQSLQDNRPRYSDIYYFGKKNNESNKNKGMGGLLRYKHQNNVTSAQVQHEPTRSSAQSVQAEAASSNSGAQTRRFLGGNNGKMVSIKENKPCPATSGVTKGDMVATVSHIRIGPRESCPVHGKEPCQGPRCIVATSGAEDQAPVKVSTMTNPRRGVFELVIRRMNGAPLARNELMLEWTPPPPRSSTCGSPCGTPCFTGPLCRPSRCKMLVCRPSPCRPARCCKKPCKRPCGPIPCRNIPCKKCYRLSCCGNPCRYYKPCRPCSPCQPSPRCRPCPPLPRCRPCPPLPRCRPCPPLPRCRPCPPLPRCRPCLPLPRCRPCPPLPRCRPCPTSPRCRPCLPSPRCRPCPPLPRCRPCPPLPRCRPCPPSPRCNPCPPSPCQTVCCSSPCSTPCKSSPCLRPCPVGYKKPRKFRCHLKIKAHRKLISPCYNRSKTCPVVRCRSVPGPCIGWCSILPCPPRKRCSAFPCLPRRCYPTFPCSTRKCCIAPCPPRKCCPPACPPLNCCPSVCPPSKCCLGSPCKLPKCCKSSCGNCS